MTGFNAVAMLVPEGVNGVGNIAQTKTVHETPAQSSWNPKVIRRALYGADRIAN